MHGRRTWHGALFRFPAALLRKQMPHHTVRGPRSSADNSRKVQMYLAHVDCSSAGCSAPLVPPQSIFPVSQIVSPARAASRHTIRGCRSVKATRPDGDTAGPSRQMATSAQLRLMSDLKAIKASAAEWLIRRPQKRPKTPTHACCGPRGLLGKAAGIRRRFSACARRHRLAATRHARRPTLAAFCGRSSPRPFPITVRQLQVEPPEGCSASPLSDDNLFVWGGMLPAGSGCPPVPKCPFCRPRAGSGRSFLLLRPCLYCPVLQQQY